MNRSAALAAVLSLAAGASAAGQGLVVDHASVGRTDRIPDATIAKVRELDVLFGHQSVGANILDGLGMLGPRFAIEPVIEPEATWYDENHGLGEFPVGDNEDPLGKIENFRRMIGEGGFGKRIDVAMMKLCYVDFTGDLEAARGVYESYGAMMDALEKELPRVRFVWWTAPLMESDNAGRNEFNRLVRAHCEAHGKILFDLADIESHDESGTPHRADGEPALCPEWSEDGGHLSEAGRRRVATAWWYLMARLAGWEE